MGPQLQELLKKLPAGKSHAGGHVMLIKFLYHRAKNPLAALPTTAETCKYFPEGRQLRAGEATAP